MTQELYTTLGELIQLADAQQKCLAMQQLAVSWREIPSDPSTTIKRIPNPGLPASLRLVRPGELKRRGLASQAGRNCLMHAIAHIEFNAINLAMDAAYRFRHLPQQYCADWIAVAADEARHFNLIRDYLRANECDYGAFPAHNGLWEMALQTDHDVLARMALVPRVLEARGLDVTPAMISRLQGVKDYAAAEILETIYQDEIQHVAIGSHWYHYLCSERGLPAQDTFRALVAEHLHGELRGPFNIEARLLAGFAQSELDRLG